jgi:hypothetical protein
VGHPDLSFRNRWVSGLGIAAVLLAIIAAPGTAARAATLPGPTTLSTGFVDDGLFEYPNPYVDLKWLGDAESLGSTWVRLSAAWATIASKPLKRGSSATDPANPGYYWPVLDAAVRSAAATDQHVVMMIFTTPNWAEGPGRPPQFGSWKPNAKAFGEFARAVATRYSGHYPDPAYPGKMLPAVTDFQIWNEPNLPDSLAPQWTKLRGGGYAPASPGIYRGLLNSGYANITAVQPHAYVLAAGTAPYGDPPGVDRMQPLTFDSALLCLHATSLRRERCPAPAHFDAFDTHPYALNPTIHALDPGDVSVPDVAKIIHLLAVAGRDHLDAPAGPKAMWVTELDWASKPGDPTGLSQLTQRRYLDYALYELWRQGVSHVFWFELVDPGADPNAVPGAGVLFQNGKPKPSAQAFRFPFIAVPNRDGGLIVWGQAPAAGTVEIQDGNGHGWHPLLTLTANADGIFYAPAVHLRAHLILRAVQGTLASPGWRAIINAKG